MENLTEYTPTELLKMGNDLKKNYDKLKDEIISDTEKVEEFEIIINSKLEKLKEYENEYIRLIEELNNR